MSESKKKKLKETSCAQNRVKKGIIASIPIVSNLANLGIRFFSERKNAEAKKEAMQNVNKTIRDNLESINKTIGNNLPTNNVILSQELTEETITVDYVMNEDLSKGTSYELKDFIEGIEGEESSSLEDLDIDFLFE